MRNLEESLRKDEDIACIISFIIMSIRKLVNTPIIYTIGSIFIRDIN